MRLNRLHTKMRRERQKKNRKQLNIRKQLQNIRPNNNNNKTSRSRPVSSLEAQLRARQQQFGIDVYDVAVEILSVASNKTRGGGGLGSIDVPLLIYFALWYVGNYFVSNIFSFHFLEPIFWELCKKRKPILLRSFNTSLR